MPHVPFPSWYSSLITEDIPRLDRANEKLIMMTIAGVVEKLPSICRYRCGEDAGSRGVDETLGQVQSRDLTSGTPCSQARVLEDWSHASYLVAWIHGV